MSVKVITYDVGTTGLKTCMFSILPKIASGTSQARQMLMNFMYWKMAVCSTTWRLTIRFHW